MPDDPRRFKAIYACAHIPCDACKQPPEGKQSYFDHAREKKRKKDGSPCAWVICRLCMENAPDLPMLEHLLPKPKEKKVQSHHPSPENATTRHTDPSELITLREQVQSLEKQIAELRRNFEVDGFFLCNQSDRAPTHAKPLVIKPAIIKEKSQCLN